MTGASRTCRKCGGAGFRRLLGPLFIECGKCKGSGEAITLSARLWAWLWG